MNDLITIVVPIYNVENYINDCIQSIINQTYKNLQIILVDDGSRDNCPKICDEYKQKDSRIEVIHKKNGGLSDARNAGIEKANGKFICFIDSDDFINYEYVEKLYNLITKNNADISISNFKRVQDFKKEYLKEEEENKTEQIYTGKQMIENIYNKKLYVQSTVTWNKMYKTELFKTTNFPYGKLHEDEYTTYKLYYNCKKVVMSSEILYYYRYVPNSIMNKKFNKKRLDGIAALEERLKFFQAKEEKKLYNLTLVRYLTVLMIHYTNCKMFLENSEEIQKELKNKYKKYYKKVIKLPECSKQDKLKIILFRVSPKLYYKMRKYSKKVNGDI